MPRDLRLGLVGCGRIAERGYVPALRLVRGMRLAALADPVPSRCCQLVPGLPSFPDAATMIAAGGIDAIVLATPVSTHLADARRAEKAGLPTLVEKPPAMSAEEAAALASIVPPPWIGFNRRFDPRLARLRAAVPANGDVALSLDLHYGTGSWRPYAVSDDALFAVGTHLIDLARWLTRSDVHRARAVTLGPNRAVLELELTRGPARISCATDQPPRDRIEVRNGAGRQIARHDGVGLWPQAHLLMTMLRDPNLRRLIQPASRTSLVRLLIRELEAFASAARGGEASSLATAADGLAVMSVVDAARRSASEGASWQPLQVATLRP